MKKLIALPEAILRIENLVRKVEYVSGRFAQSANGKRQMRDLKKALADGDLNAAINICSECKQNFRDKTLPHERCRAWQDELMDIDGMIWDARKAGIVG